MDKDLTAEILKRLDVLSEKLGTTATHLWAVLVKQAYITGIADSVAAGFMLFLVVVGYKLLKAGWVAAVKDHWDDFPVRVIAGVLLVVVCAVLFGCSVYSAVLELGNPEYFALHEILTVFGK